MFRTLIPCIALVLLLSLGAAPAVAQTDARPPAKAEALMTAFRTNQNVDAKLRALRSLEKFHTPPVDNFLLSEYSKLDNSRPADAQLIGGILRVWAGRPSRSVLPFLIYEGLFHDDADVVRASALAVAQLPEEARAVMSTGRARRGKDPAESLAADLIERMGERTELLPALEKVLVMWSGKSRPGFKPQAGLKRAPDDKERAAALEFWKGWFEGRFKSRSNPAVAPSK
jgi:hypothetical protein